MREFTPGEHLAYLAEFMRRDKELGGPDQHIATLGPLLEGLPLEERIWRCGCYASVYNVPAAEAIWSRFAYSRARSAPGEIEPWLAANWQHIALRRERRGVRAPHKLARCLLSYLEWMPNRPMQAWHDPEGYEEVWESTGTVFFLGRYIQIKLLEALHRHAEGAFVLGDLRPVGGDSPRATLAWMYPAHAVDLIHGGNSKEALATVDMCGRWALEELSERHGVQASWFELQVGLCEYKSAYSKPRQYPGRTLDTELHYWEKVRGLGHVSRFLEARQQIAPEVALGEVHGWVGARNQLGTLLREHGYLWSDLRYDYGLTFDYAHPVCRS